MSEMQQRSLFVLMMELKRLSLTVQIEATTWFIYGYMQHRLSLS